ncbi:MAG: hypothetical protein AVO39_06460 [delta proteobacterium MLS_D]|nr:MAG: hypothetical protein AVO39_06460 [delta proteobacterium MLS_D]
MSMRMHHGFRVMERAATAFIAVLVMMSFCWVTTAAGKPVTQQLPSVSEPTADHSILEELDQPMERGPDVTRTCLSCHTEAGNQVQKTIHWTWGEGEMGEEGLGKAHIINNF